MVMKIRQLLFLAQRCSLGSGIAFLVLAPIPALAQGFVPDPWTAEIRNLDGTRQMCLDVPGGNTADQVRLQMFPCHGGPNQRWLLRFDFSGFVIVESVGTGRRAPGALTFFEDNGVRGDRLCGLSPVTGEYRFEQPGARACENDEARSLFLYEVAAGTEIEVFDDGRCRTNDDSTRITVKQRGIASYDLDSFERGFEDELLRVERLTSGNLDGKVSCVRIRTPG